MMIRLLLFVLVVILIYILYIVGIFVIDEWKMRKAAPYVGSYISHRKLLVKYRAKFQGKNILDMGCGDGGILRLFIKKIGYSGGVGYDIRRFPIRVGSILNRAYGCKNIILHQQDFYKAHLSQYDTIYLFLWSDIIVKLEKRIYDNIRSDTVVVTNTFHFRNWEPFDVIKNSKGKVVFQLYKKG